MTRRTPPKLATALFTRLGPDNPALAGDLLEAFHAGRSAWWYWRQVLVVIAIDACRRIVCLSPASSAAAATVAATVCLELPYLLHPPMAVDARQWFLMALYLAPQGLVVAFPIGLAIGIARGGPLRMSPPTALWVALCTATATFAVVGWLVPACNDAYRFVVAGRPAWRGAPELNIMELRALMKGDGAIFAPLADPWEVAVNYYGRFALSLAPMAFVLLARSAAALDRRSGRIVLIATAVSYFPVFLTPDAYLRTLPPLLLAWFPPAMVVAVALLLRRFGRQRPTPA